MTKYKYVVVGGGNAAGYAAKEFQAKGVEDHSVLIVSAESVPPYERPALSKGYLAREKPARLPGFHTSVGGGGDRQDEEWYKKHGIDFHGKTRVTDLDVQAKCVRCDNGQEVQYDKLIIATGAEPIRINIGGNADDVCYLRDVEDADNLVRVMKLHGEGKRAIVIGGGYIGTEVGAGLINNGLKVTFVFPEDHFMSRLFTPKIAQVYQDAFERRGAKIVKGMAKTIATDDTGKMVGLKINDDGDVVDGDFCVAGIGARTNLDLFKDKLEIDNKGVKVNGSMQTSDPDVYAIGDIAAFPLKIEEGKVQRQEHVNNARQTAKHAVDSILRAEKGQSPEDYDYLPNFYSRLFDFSWKFFGVNEGDVVHFGDFEEGKQFGALWIRDNKVVGLFLESGSDEQNTKLAKMARERPEVQGDDAVRDVLSDLMGPDVKSHL